ncbi:DNA repair protein RecN [Arenibacter sp. GZD96]|uniref:DNA repair protein RecN n=1 Tax=Aurantibrevibacter litoralis TaxID=3106030 RepID=UPI002AFF1092|nr:DNA repair protein RecN [Arenibacter sp. GZD-96]MEA1786349.1 DNA repair protein RecN [Arenibacter sp. GZD-96]
MLSSLSITNYTLIDHLNVTFKNGLTTITGETGAGKSILLGGLSLVLGKRADLQSLKDNTAKCIVEAEFEISEYPLRPFFDENELDYEATTLLRREILPSGKSRAFINDTPVTLDVLSFLGDRLIDVHSQHQTLQLADADFQMKVIDALAANTHILAEYNILLTSYQKTLKELTTLSDFQEKAKKDQEYHLFMLEELQQANLKPGMQEAMEEELAQLSNVETLMELCAKGQQLLYDEHLGIIYTLTELKQVAQKLASFGNRYSAMNERLHSTLIELKDIAVEFSSFNDNLEVNPLVLQEIDGKLQALYGLQKKHNAQDVVQLIAIRDELASKVNAVEHVGSQLKSLQASLNAKKKELEQKATLIRSRRQHVIPVLKKQLQDTLFTLGMPGTSFKIELIPAKEFKENGMDDILFLLSANKGMAHGELKKVASGGELSRIMLTIKSILATYEKLPTMMFDEIDSGVSGEISNKMADIMKEMSKTMQVFAITHLPQVAAKGDYHFKVYKQEDGKGIATKMKQLSLEDRVLELAEMLGGKSIADSAIAHAKQLLN